MLVCRWHNQEGWVLWACHRGSTLCYNSQRFSVTPILAPVFDAPFIAMCTERLFCWRACWETAVGTGWSTAGDSRSAPTYRACLWLRGETTVWMCGRMERWGGEGNVDGRRAAAFISWKLIPPFVHLSPSDKMGRLWLWCPVFSFFSTLLHPSIVMGLSWAGRKEACYWFGNEL